MKHSYFRQLGMNVHTLPEGESTQNPALPLIVHLSPSLFGANTRSCVAGVSLFTLQEVQLQKDLGYRNSSFPDAGEGRHAHLHRDVDQNHQVF